MGQVVTQAFGAWVERDPARKALDAKRDGDQMAATDRTRKIAVK